MPSVISKLFLFLLCLATSCLTPALAKEITPLPADQAFTFSVYLNQPNELILQWKIAPGYYLYRSKLNLTPATTNQIHWREIRLPEGVARQDTLHGVYQAYVGSIKIPVTLQNLKGKLNLNIRYQGCSNAGFCYPPIKKLLAVDLAQISAPRDLTPYTQSVSASRHETMTQDSTEQLFAQHNLFIVMLSFLGLGLLLAFTPCVLPMVPILSGIVVGHQKKSTPRQTFFLSLAYVSGMAITYALVGIVIALIGSSIQADLQKPWIIVLLSCLFILLALSLFGLYELQLPSTWRQRLSTLSNRQKGGTYLGVFLMGSLSTLIVSPCVSAPLVGVLAYIGQSGNVLLGGMALLTMGIGMGIPLLLIGASAGKFLPKAGSWMLTIERTFGIIMLGAAIWMLSRIVAGPIALFLWALLAVSAAIFLVVFVSAPGRWGWLTRSFGVVIFVYGIILFTGSLMGNSNPLQPWDGFQHFLSQRESPQKKLPFIRVHSMKELNKQLAAAKLNKQRVLLDFYADWCGSCVDIDRRVFSQATVHAALVPFLLLRVDLTANSPDELAILKHLNVIGPPTILFYERNGQELTSLRIVGEVDERVFLQRINKIEEEN